MPANRNRKSSEIKLLRRYQRSLLLWGGALLSAALVAGACLAVWADIQDYIAEGHSAYVTNKALITQEIEKKQCAMRRGVIYSELVWHATGTQRHVDDFQTGRLLMQANPYVVSQLVLGDVSPARPPQRFARLLEFSETQAYGMTASARERGESFAGYFFDPTHSFVSIASPPSANILLNNISSSNIRRLIDRLAPDIGDLNDPVYLASLRESRRVFWQPPGPDPFTGETVLQVAAPGFEGARPFAVFVSSISVNVLYKWLRKSRYGGNFMIIDKAGKLILSSWDQGTIDPTLSTRVLNSGAWHEQLDTSDYVYRDGTFTISEPLADTGWVFAYAWSGRTIMAARGNFIMVYAAATLLLLGLLWTLIYVYLKKVLNPLLLRSQRVFDSEQLNRTIIATAPNGLCLISESSGKVLLQNAAMQLYDNDEAPLSERLRTLWQESDRSMPVAAGGAVVPTAMHELTVTARDDERRHLLINIVRTRYLSEELLLCSFSDITERKQLERSLREARVAAEAANQAKSAFLATMSHEIRTPLNGILGNLELLAHTALTELQQDRLQTVMCSSHTLLEIINDVLDFSKIESEQMQLEHIRFDLIDLVEQTLAIFVPIAADKRLDLYYRVAPQLPRWHMGDPTRVRQIVINLLSNAIKFTARGKVSITLDAGATGDDGKTALMVRVADTGPGISMERRKQLFQPFEQGDASVARKYGGTGLGLALCHRLTQLMDGAIEMQSEPGQGTTFSVTLPLQAAAEVAAPVWVSGCEIGVLCVSSEWRSQLFAQLQAWGFTVRLLQQLEEWQGNTAPLLLFGARRTWSVAAEETRMESGLRIIDVREDGPRMPVLQGKRILVSCYSLEGLQRALWLAQNSPSSGDGTDACQRDLPQESASHADGGMPAPRQQDAARVLVVEDHPVNRELIGDQLHLLGYDASLAADAGEALQLYAADRYDIVLTDLSMQPIDGYMLARMLREQGARLPIVAVTAHASPDDHRRCLAAGIDDVLLKPMSLRAIDRIMRRHLAAARLRSSQDLPEQQERMLSGHLLQVLRDTTEASLAQMQAAGAGAHPRHDMVLEQLHAIKGAFAMQQQAEVVTACCNLEIDCKSGLPDDFKLRLEALQDLVHQVLKRIGQTASR